MPVIISHSPRGRLQMSRLSNQQSKPQMHLKLKSAKVLKFLLQEILKQLFDYQNICRLIFCRLTSLLIDQLIN